MRHSEGFLAASWAAVQVIGYVNRVRDVEANVDNATFTMAQVESNPVRCPDPESAERMYQGKPQTPIPRLSTLILDAHGLAACRIYEGDKRQDLWSDEPMSWAIGWE